MINRLMSATILIIREVGSRQEGNGTDSDDWSAKIIAQTEKSWVVSGSSVLAAWVAAVLGSLIILTIYSFARRNDSFTFFPRYQDLLDRASYIDSQRSKGLWCPTVPSSDPNRSDMERPKIMTQIDEKDSEKGVRAVKEIGEEFSAPLLGWLRPAWHNFLIELNLMNTAKAQERDDKSLDSLGLDAFTFLQFLRLLRWLFTMITVFIALPLICANYFINTQTEYGSVSSLGAGGSSNMTSAIGNLTTFTAGNITGNGLWVHISAELGVTAIVYLQMVIYARRHERIVEKWSDMNANEVAFKTILVTRLSIPAQYKGRPLSILDAKAKIKFLLGLPAGDEVEITIKQEKMGDFADKIKRWNEVERKRVAARLQVWADNKEGVAKSCSCFGTEAVLKERKAKVVSEGRTLMKAQLNEQEKRKMTENQGYVQADVSAAFVTWRTAKLAHERLQEIRKKKKNKTFKVERSPRSQSILWRNLEKDVKVLAIHRIIGSIARWIITILNSIPLILITILANLDALIEANDQLRTMRESSIFWNAVFTAAGGILPALLAALFMMALPYLMRFLSGWQGSLSEGELDKDVIRQMFTFTLISKFVVFSLLGIGYDTYLKVSDQIGKAPVSEIFASLGDLPAKITRAYISQNSYWLSFFPIKCVVLCLQLLQIPRVLKKFYQFYLKMETNTPLKLKEAEPALFEYAINYTDILFGLVVALVYTPLAPIVAICGCIYFWTASIVNQITFVEGTVEKDGKVWRTVMNRLLVGLTMMQSLMVLTIILKTSPFDTESKVPIGTRLAPTICAAIPLVFTALAYRHLRSCRTDAEIISNRNVPVDAVQSDRPPKFELDILQDGAIKGIPVFSKDIKKFVELSKKQGMKGVEDLLPQVKRAKRQEAINAMAEKRAKRQERRAMRRKRREG